MHDSEKSDSAIVAVKPPNKAGLPVAEAVERRAGAKGNADQQSTHRTQSRICVTQALNRVRQAARYRRKKAVAQQVDDAGLHCRPRETNPNARTSAALAQVDRLRDRLSVSGAKDAMRDLHGDRDNGGISYNR